MISYEPEGKYAFKLVDLGNAYYVGDLRRPGGTLQYCAPENVIGRWNKCRTSDVFSAGLVLAETFLRAPLLPMSLLEGYAYQGCEAAKLQRRQTAPLYHLVLLASIVAGREVWAGRMVRRYYGKYPKCRVQDCVMQSFPDAINEIGLALVRYMIFRCPRST